MREIIRTCVLVHEFTECTLRLILSFKYGLAFFFSLMKTGRGWRRILYMTPRIYIESPLMSCPILFALVIAHLSAVVLCTALHTSNILGLVTSLFGCSASQHPHHSACCILSKIVNTPSKSASSFGQYDTRIPIRGRRRKTANLCDTKFVLSSYEGQACRRQHHAIRHLLVGFLGIYAVSNLMSEKRSWHTRVSMQ
jgi:hypothetical protein